MMAFAIANVPQVYDECDHNVMRLAPLHGCHARSARCADKQRTIGDAVYGCFHPTRKVMSGTPLRDPEKWGPVFGQDHARQRVIPKSGERFSVKITHDRADLEKWGPVFGQDHAR